MITRNFNLYLNAGHSIPLVINANQAEEGEQWVFSLFQEDGTPYIPTDGSIVGIKSDGYLINNSGTVVDGKVVITETRQMTAAAGKSVFELRIDGLTHGTANFIVLVEKDPTNGGIVSDSDLSLIEEALSAVSPLPTGGTVGQVLTKTANGSAWSDAGTPTQEQVAEAVSDWADENITVSTGVVIDNSLSVSGAAADAKKTGDEISDLKSQISSLEAIQRSVKLAMDNLFAKAVYGDANASDDYSTFHVWASAINVLSISAVFDQGENLIFSCDSLDELRQYLTVTGSFDDGTSAVVSGYTLSGTLTSGTSTITVTYGGKTDTIVVSVTEGTDIAPSLSAFSVTGSVAQSINTSTNSIRVYTTSNGGYKGTTASLPTLKEGYSYKISVDATITKGNAKVAFINADTEQTMGGAPASGAIASSGHLENTFIPSTATSWNASAGIRMYCTWTTSTAGDVTFSNLKVIEYLAEE